MRLPMPPLLHRKSPSGIQIVPPREHQQLQRPLLRGAANGTPPQVAPLPHLPRVAGTPLLAGLLRRRSAGIQRQAELPQQVRARSGIRLRVELRRAGLGGTRLLDALLRAHRRGGMQLLEEPPREAVRLHRVGRAAGMPPPVRPQLALPHIASVRLREERPQGPRNRDGMRRPTSTKRWTELRE